MAQLTASGLDAFRAELEGTALLPGEEGYDTARAVWNGAIDRRPAVIARCTSAQDVARAVAFARSEGLEIAVRGGGHNYAGHAVCEGGLMIDLSRMNGVSVDAGAMRATAGGGATWGDIDAATQEHGLAVPGGFISHTGIAGLTLGGGIGWLTKKAGLSCDNLVGAEVVTADSRIVRASAEENPDLLWALRGGGGNFGVVTSFEFALHRVGPMVNLGLFFWPLEQGTEALRFIRDFLPTLTDDDDNAFIGVGLSAPPAPFVPEEHHFRPGHALVVVGLGTPEEHARAIAPVLGGSLAPLFQLVTPMPYVALQQMFNESAHWGTHGYEKALYLDELSDAVIEVIGEHAGRKTFPLSFAPLFGMSGAYGRVGDDETAFGGSRSARFVLNIAGHGTEQAVYEAERAWVRAFWDAMRPHATGSGGYVNFMAEADEDRVRATYGAKYDRLARIKAEYDPDNVFHLNANIRPATV